MGNIFVDDATEEVTEKGTEQDLNGTHTSDLEFQEFQKYTKMLEPIEVKTKHALPSPVRTQGDGMENIDEKTEPQVTSPPVAKISHTTLGDTLLYRPQKSASFSKPPPVITGKIVNLVPKTVSHPRKDKIVLGSLKGKEPKFVPYEPYKAAVNPIIPPERKNKSREKKCSIKSDVPLLIACAVPVETAKEAIVSSNGGMDETSVSVCEWEKERKLLDDEIKQLKEENSQLESQLKFQAQVNGELKNLLVAAVGEDLETRVHILTEDKLQLARALLNSAQRLSTHQEQTEWLAGQCEVWRSKFLASSLMVEELARWKAALSQKATDLQETMKRLLEERVKVRETLLHAYRNLKVLCDNFDPVSGHSTRKCDLPSTNMIDLAAGNLKLSESLQLHLLGSQNNMKKKEVDVTGLDMQTCAEKMAEQLLKNHNNLLSGLPDIACSAVMGAAVAVGGQLFRHGGTPVSCCAHCSGEMKLV